MRRVLFGLAALALVGLAADTARAARPNPGYGSSRGYYSRTGNIGGYGYTEFGYYSSLPYSTRSNSFTDAVNRIRAEYSRYRYSPHPRSSYRANPYLDYYYLGW